MGNSTRLSVVVLGYGMRLCLGICLAICASFASPQTNEKPPSLSIAHVAIRVADLAVSRAFYSSLGYEEAFAFDKGGTPTEAFFKINDRQFLELYPRQKLDQEIGFLHVCFESNDLTAVNQFYEAHGLHPTAVRKAGAGNLLFTMEGPEKQNIEFTQYMPGSRHTLDIGKHLGPNRIGDSILGVGISMSDTAAAVTFYTNAMQFAPLRRGNESAAGAFSLAGSDEELDILDKGLDAHFHLLIHSANLKETSRRLKSLHIPARREGHTLVIHDPDGNLIVLVPPSEKIQP